MPDNSREKKLEAFGRLLDILDELRVKCPWDRKQTNESLRPNTIEETMELADAIMGEDDDKIRKELGDVLLHIVFYAKIGDEKGKFDIADVCDALCEKLVYRHPHVFGDEKADTAAQVLKNWELIKMSEKTVTRWYSVGYHAVCRHSSKPSEYRRRLPMWDLTGSSARTSGTKCVRNSTRWRPN